MASYTPTNWVDNVTPLSAENMNHIETGIKNAISALTGAGIDANILQSHNIGSSLAFADLIKKKVVTFFTNWNDTTNFPAKYGSGILIPTLDSTDKVIYYQVKNDAWFGYIKLASDSVTLSSITWNSISKDGKTVWQNANPGGSFGATTISLSLDRTYSKYEILYFSTYSGSLAESVLKTTGILPFGTKCNLSDVYPLTGTGTLVNMARKATAKATQIVFEDAIVPDATVGVNWYCIPYKVIFYP